MHALLAAVVEWNVRPTGGRCKKNRCVPNGGCFTRPINCELPLFPKTFSRDQFSGKFMMKQPDHTFTPPKTGDAQRAL
jgi:hypothetical protein